MVKVDGIKRIYSCLVLLYFVRVVISVQSEQSNSPLNEERFLKVGWTQTAINSVTIGWIVILFL